MNIYESATGYAKELNISVGQAIFRIDYFNKIGELVEMSRICPKCQQKSLNHEVDDQVYHLDIESHPSWVSCMNCNFIAHDDEHYLFTKNIDVDDLYELSRIVNVYDEQAVMEVFGFSWASLVEEYTEKISDILEQLENSLKGHETIKS